MYNSISMTKGKKYILLSKDGKTQNKEIISTGEYFSDYKYHYFVCDPEIHHIINSPFDVVVGQKYIVVYDIRKWNDDYHICIADGRNCETGNVDFYFTYANGRREDFTLNVFVHNVIIKKENIQTMVNSEEFSKNNSQVVDIIKNQNMLKFYLDNISEKLNIQDKKIIQKKFNNIDMLDVLTKPMTPKDVNSLNCSRYKSKEEQVIEHINFELINCGRFFNYSIIINISEYQEKFNITIDQLRFIIKQFKEIGWYAKEFDNGTISILKY
jgi:hypothetical protein